MISYTKETSQIQLINPENFKKLIHNKQVNLYTLKNKQGTTCQITNYGGRVVSLWVADQNGNYDDIVLGYDHIDGYLKSNEQYFGALIGRFGNRIANGKFKLNNTTYDLAINNGANHLHGGNIGFNNVVWDATKVSDSQLELSYLSKDMEEGFPGNLTVKVTYSLTSNNALKIIYTATTDHTTPVNLTHHSFFNLHGAGKSAITDHILQINASRYTPIVDGLLPTGEIASVKGTALDFTSPTAIGLRINTKNDQLKFGFGYDHNFVLDGTGLKTAAKIVAPKSGRVMEVITDEPGMQLYSGNFLSGKDIGKENLPYEYRTAFCLETQHYPDSPNQLQFPSTFLKPEEIYTSTCIYKFSITKNVKA
ncbi:MAG: aldose epimerase family protein [Cellulophaga sp.]